MIDAANFFESKGFKVAHLGGGCTAWKLWAPDEEHWLLVTDDSGCDLPEIGSNQMMAGIYNGTSLQEGEVKTGLSRGTVMHAVALERYGYEKARRIGMVAMIGGKHKERERDATPIEFRDVLIDMALTVKGAIPCS